MTKDSIFNSYIYSTVTHVHEVKVYFIFRYTVTEPVDNAWGIETENGTWNGMIGRVIRKVQNEILSLHDKRFLTI